MALYVYQCEECGNKIEVIQPTGGVVQLCCGKAMAKLPTFPSKITIKNKGGTPARSKGYKEDYSKEYLRRLQET